MIRGYAAEAGRLLPLADPAADIARVVWLDLIAPTAEEEAEAERLLGIDVPTRDEMEEIEESSRLYTEDGAVFMTAIVPANLGTPEQEVAPVSFIIAGSRLVTIRYHQPRAFAAFAARAEKSDLGCVGGPTVLMALLDAVVDRLADILEKSGREIESISHSVFRPDETGRTDFQQVLRRIGGVGDTVSTVSDSLVTIGRLIAFMTLVAEQRRWGKSERARAKTLSRDARFLTEHANALAQKVTFLLDATLGMISIEQNQIIKIFSVAAVVFLPPTLIASIYGMNFADMPELGWKLGYPIALGLMVLSAAVSLWFFKSRRWL